MKKKNGKPALKQRNDEKKGIQILWQNETIGTTA